MSLKSSTKVASLVLSGLMAATCFAGLGRQSVKAETAKTEAAKTEAAKTEAAKTEAAKTETAKTEAAKTDTVPAPGTTNNSQPDGQSIQPPTGPIPASPQTKRLRNSKVKHSSTTPEPLEPFIQADAVALGQWLMIKSVKTLVATPSSGGAKPTSAAKPATGAKPASPATGAKPANPAQSRATAPTSPVQQSAPAPKVSVKALPPEPSNNATIDSYTEMRVALTKQASNVMVAASSGGALITPDGSLIEDLAAGVGYQVSANGQGLLVNGQPVPSAIWLEPDNGYVAVGDRWYRGRLLLLWQDGGVMAVNYVLLRDYLYSVVGAEMSASWSLEALKAQAVAARSYAIVHTVRHHGRAYDLDDTQRYQAYKGVLTEASSTHQAVHDTAGEFISYDGGVVESLYAANQDIVDDAHSGYGMSQTGALDLAQQGYLYYEILSAYYPDTSVGRIDVN
ncbi:SpoIID/LytB domain-containing protein [Leptothoe sp. PORK10 BA2]|uniref:SpoIID/LytB domain-containing protein n=1 Tax=Leptothoe sp. PORK10 BA2 TaxID=3110254 RepID=UPI002B201C9D|nr:SpoIID/LytB domain-containing protein [Leptothoe sp. PORK10 BA2]MEA5463573.1 SpoIID/LytB domain-containing protein [Leptothoe sp. PORK10 BA2]